MFDGFLMVVNSGEARGLVFWAMDPVWSPPQAPGDRMYMKIIGVILHEKLVIKQSFTLD